MAKHCCKSSRKLFFHSFIMLWEYVWWFCIVFRSTVQKLCRRKWSTTEENDVLQKLYRRWILDGFDNHYGTIHFQNPNELCVGLEEYFKSNLLWFFCGSKVNISCLRCQLLANESLWLLQSSKNFIPPPPHLLGKGGDVRVSSLSANASCRRCCHATLSFLLAIAQCLA